MPGKALRLKIIPKYPKQNIYQANQTKSTNQLVLIYGD